MDWIARILNRARTHFARRRAIAELQRYDDWMLADIGITREEIVPFVHGTLNRRAQRAGEVIDFAMHRKRIADHSAAGHDHAA